MHYDHINHFSVGGSHNLELASPVGECMGEDESVGNCL